MKNLTQVYEGGRGGREGAPVEGSLRDLLCYRELIVDVGNARYLHSLVGDFLFLRAIFHVTAQCNSTVACNHGYVLSGCGQGTVRSESLSNVLCDLSVGLICRLIGCCRAF